MSYISAPDFVTELPKNKWSDVILQSRKLQDSVDKSATHFKECSFLSVLTDEKGSAETSKKKQIYCADVDSERTTKRIHFENKKQIDSANKEDAKAIESQADKPLLRGQSFLKLETSSELPILRTLDISSESPVLCVDDLEFDVYAHDSNSFPSEDFALMKDMQPEIPLVTKGIQLFESEVFGVRMDLVNPDGTESDGLNERELVVTEWDRPNTDVKKPDARIDTILKSIQAAAPLEMHRVSIVASNPANVSIAPILLSSFLFNDSIPEDVGFEGEDQEITLFVDTSTNQKQLLNKNVGAETKGGFDESFSGESEHHAGQISTTATEVSIQKALAVQQIMQTFRARINEANLRNSGNTSINVQLTHQTLGDVDVQLKIKDNKVSTKFFGEKKVMQNLLRQNISNIESILTEAGLSLDSDPILIYQKEI
ncbi:MAG: flagellar hook-length control protein FliK [Pseudomonadota bacterium]